MMIKELDKYDDFEYDEAEDKSGRRIRASGRRKKRGVTGSDKAAKENLRKQARQERIEQARAKIDQFKQEKFGKLKGRELEKQIADYTRWVNESLAVGFALLDEKNIEYEAVLGTGPGGQNVQKNRTAAIARHLPTRIWARNQEERKLEENKAAARNRLFEKLEAHLELWKVVA